MADFLSTMADRSSERAQDLRRRPLGAMALALGDPWMPGDHGFDLIAEAKLAGPSTGRLLPEGDDARIVVDQTDDFVTGGASVVSVLTEPSVFAGSLEHLRAVADSTGLPVMRKDFLVDPLQVEEALAYGASGVLLLPRILGPSLLTEMVDLTVDLGMFSLVEVFDARDIELASVVFDREVLVGVNSRNLTDLSVDPGRFASLAPLLPSHLPRVAESGLDSPDDIAAVVELGYSLALVGTSLSRSADVSGAVTSMVKAGRSTAVKV